MQTTSPTGTDASISDFTTPRIYTCLTDATRPFRYSQPIAAQSSRWEGLPIPSGEHASVRLGAQQHGQAAKTRSAHFTTRGCRARHRLRCVPPPPRSLGGHGNDEDNSPSRVTLGLLDRLLASVGQNGQLAGEPMPADAPAPGPDGAHGRFYSQAKRISWTLFASRHRMASGNEAALTIAARRS
jgi:hypothetical protein